MPETSTTTAESSARYAATPIASTGPLKGGSMILKRIREAEMKPNTAINPPRAAGFNGARSRAAAHTRPTTTKLIARIRLLVWGVGSQPLQVVSLPLETVV
jgi:hypothetical protein